MILWSLPGPAPQQAVMLHGNAAASCAVMLNEPGFEPTGSWVPPHPVDEEYGMKVWLDAHPKFPCQVWMQGRVTYLLLVPVISF